MRFEICVPIKNVKQELCDVCIYSHSSRVKVENKRKELLKKGGSFLQCKIIVWSY